MKAIKNLFSTDNLNIFIIFILIMTVPGLLAVALKSDRPYKKAKSVSASIDILYKMVLDEHVDRNIFELFLRSGIYRRYAEKYLIVPA